jgi:hypothetical protein
MKMSYFSGLERRGFTEKWIKKNMTRRQDGYFYFCVPGLVELRLKLCYYMSDMER